MENVMMIVASMLLGLAFGLAIMWALSSRVARAELARVVEANEDMGRLLERARGLYEAEMRRLADRAAAQIDLSFTLGQEVVREQVRAVRAEREAREARSAVALSLRFYGAAVERAEVAEVELARERIVSAGLEQLLSLPAPTVGSGS